MDSKQASMSGRRHLRAGTYATAFVVSVLALGFGFFRRKPTTTVVNREGLRVSSVQRGDMIRTVSGSGTLVPRMTRVIPAFTDGQIEQCLVQPGAKVQANEIGRASCRERV